MPPCTRILAKVALNVKPTAAANIHSAPRSLLDSRDHRQAAAEFTCGPQSLRAEAARAAPPAAGRSPDLASFPPRSPMKIADVATTAAPTQVQKPGIPTKSRKP